MTLNVFEITDGECPVISGSGRLSLRWHPLGITLTVQRVVLSTAHVGLPKGRPHPRAWHGKVPASTATVTATQAASLLKSHLVSPPPYPVTPPVGLFSSTKLGGLRRCHHAG